MCLSARGRGRGGGLSKLCAANTCCPPLASDKLSTSTTCGAFLFSHSASHCDDGGDAMACAVELQQFRHVGYTCPGLSPKGRVCLRHKCCNGICCCWCCFRWGPTEKLGLDESWVDITQVRGSRLGVWWWLRACLHLPPLLAAASPGEGSQAEIVWSHVIKQAEAPRSISRCCCSLLCCTMPLMWLCHVSVAVVHVACHELTWWSAGG